MGLEARHRAALEALSETQGISMAEAVRRLIDQAQALARRESDAISEEALTAAVRRALGSMTVAPRKRRSRVKADVSAV